ncbi:MAG: hypothetical protein H5U40_00385, partial [Polyangiaceae bacterium]|nr:hypothetical protein [Polyangiaceae bacterium]
HLIILDAGKIVLPFVIGASIYRRARDARDLLMVTAMAGVVYSPLIMLEARLSPQLHDWVYGFAQHDFMQTIRFGGFRPMVFMNHGLAVAIFIAASVLATSGLARSGSPVFEFRTSRVGPFLGWILLLCKTVGAMFYALLGWLVMSFLSARAQLRVGFVLVGLLLAYPLLRSQGLIPTDDLVSTATDLVDADRAQSLEFRLVNEEALLDRALERPLFGLGTMGRACIYDRWSGDELSTRDGAWIITLGERGFVGFFLVFGLLVFPMLAARQASLVQGGPGLLVGAVAMIAGIYAFDLIPNGRYAYFCHFFAGALAGLGSGIVAERQKRRRGRPRSSPGADAPADAPPLPEAVPNHGPY